MLKFVVLFSLNEVFISGFVLVSDMYGVCFHKSNLILKVENRLHSIP